MASKLVRKLETVSFMDHAKGNICMFETPEIDEDGEKVYLPVIKVSNQIPWGYKVDEEDDQVLIPIPEELDLLYLGIDYMKKGLSSRKVANWLTTETGRPISHTGLLKRIKNERRSRKQLEVLAHYEQRHKETVEKIKWLKARQIGYTTRKGKVSTN